MSRERDHSSGPPLPPMSPALWGTPDEATPLSEDMRSLVADTLGVGTEPRTEQAEPRASESRLTESDLAALADLLGADGVTTEAEHRLRRARGKSTPDLLAWRSGEVVACPDAVVAPRSEDEVAGILDWCASEGVALVPFGGGTSVVGGLDAEPGGHRAVLSVDLAHLDELSYLDETSQIAEFGAGTPAPRVEELLAERGYLLGHFPQSFPYATIGGFAMTRSSGQASSGYGRFDEMVVGLTVVTGAGVIETGRAPGSAAGPEMTRLLLGSEGAFGVCTRVRVRVRPVPEVTRHEAFTFPDFEGAANGLRAVAQAGASPTVIRVSDETETAVNLATAHSVGAPPEVAGCLCVCEFAGDDVGVEHSLARTERLLQASGAVPRGPELAEAWERGRFSAPVLRDALLDVGALVETLETATTWANLHGLKQAVTDAITASFEGVGTTAMVLCHISHIYPTGASLYFTVAAGRSGNDPADDWRAAKRAASEAIVSAGGTITHHHAVGRDHRDYLPDEIGDVGVRALRALKDALDPAGVCNPGKLVP